MKKENSELVAKFKSFELQRKMLETAIMELEIIDDDELKPIIANLRKVLLDNWLAPHLLMKKEADK